MNYTIKVDVMVKMIQSKVCSCLLCLRVAGIHGMEDEGGQ